MSEDPAADPVGDLHARRPGVTEDLLVHARDAADRTPYQALVEGLGPGPVVDLCCGTAPVADLIGPRWRGAPARP